MSRGTVNKVILVGRLGKDPDLRYAPSGTAFASFSLATNSRQKNAEGEWDELTEWHSIKTFGRLAEFAGEYLKKGKLVYVEGRLQTSNWEDQNGQKRYRTDILANSIQLLGSRAEAEAAEQSEAPAPKSKPAETPAPQEPEEPPVEADDLPF